MQKPHFTINAIDIASANLGWLLAQLLMGTMVTKKMLTAKEAKEMLEFCQRQFSGNVPDRAPIRVAALQGLETLLIQFDVPPENQKH